MFSPGKIVVEKRVLAQTDSLPGFEFVDNSPVGAIRDRVEPEHPEVNSNQSVDRHEDRAGGVGQCRSGMDRLEALLCGAVASLSQARDISQTGMDVAKADEVIQRLESVLATLNMMQESMMQVSRLLVVPELFDEMLEMAGPEPDPSIEFFGFDWPTVTSQLINLQVQLRLTRCAVYENTHVDMFTLAICLSSILQLSAETLLHTKSVRKLKGKLLVDPSLANSSALQESRPVNAAETSKADPKGVHLRLQRWPTTTSKSRNSGSSVERQTPRGTSCHGDRSSKGSSCGDRLSSKGSFHGERSVRGQGYHADRLTRGSSHGEKTGRGSFHGERSLTAGGQRKWAREAQQQLARRSAKENGETLHPLATRKQDSSKHNNSDDRAKQNRFKDKVYLIRNIKSFMKTLYVQHS